MKFVKSTLKSRAELPLLIDQSVKAAGFDPGIYMDRAAFGVPAPKPSTIVEVGVYLGDFAGELLQHHKGWLYLVDPWNSPNCEGQLVGDETHYESVKERFEGNEQIHLIRKFSQEAVRDFETCSLDMVYLDAEHTYDGVLGDIHLWWPKIKPGGILAGHDILFYDHIGVTQAVIDSNISDVVFVTPGDRNPNTGDLVLASSWYVVKK